MKRKLHNPLSEKICIAKILTAHGVRGLVRLDCFLEDPSGLTAYNPLSTADGRLLTITLKNPAKGRWLAEIDGVADRNLAETFRNTELFIPRAALPELDDGHYHDDLDGRKVQTADGDTLGHIAGIHNFGAGDLLEIRPVSGKNFYVPFDDRHVPQITDDFAVIANFEDYRG